MKFYPRLGIYKKPNCTFNPKTLDAHSYKWWRFVAKIEGKVIFNNYRYSVTTSKHQSQVRTILSDLGIKIDLELPLPSGINSDNLETLFLQAEETLCEQFLNEELKRQERNEKARVRRIERKLEDYLENSVHFRDYDIKPASQFGHINKIAVHQKVDADSIEADVQNALHSFHRDGFGSIVFYIGV